MKMSISVSNLTYKIKDRAIINNISFDLDEGNILAILGPNGVGKSTLLKILAGIIKPSYGNIFLYGNTPERFRKHISYLPANYTVDPYATAEDVMFAELYDNKFFFSKNNRNEIRKWASLFNLNGHLNNPFGSLSSGEQKLVLLAGGFARNPKVFLLDEPTAFLDISNQAKILSLIRDLSKRNNITIVLAIHEIYYANIADKVILLKKGNIVRYGSPKNVLDKNILKDVYGIELEEMDLNNNKIFLPKDILS
jgi:ABC-type cobalamin/Fe3+-siderophores transport system ATPase subunit